MLWPSFGKSMLAAGFPAWATAVPTSVRGSLIESTVDQTTGLLVVSCKDGSGDLRIITFERRAQRLCPSAWRQLGSSWSNRCQRDNAKTPDYAFGCESGKRRPRVDRLAHSLGVVRVGNSGQDQSGGVGLVRLARDTHRPMPPSSRVSRRKEMS